MNSWQGIWGSLWWGLIICEIICTYLSGYVECGQSISWEANSTSKITWKVHSKWLYVWRALETFDKAEFKLLKYIRDEFINSNFQCLQVRNPQDIWRFLAGTLKPSGHRSPLQGEQMPESRKEKICTSNKDMTSKPSNSLDCSVFPPSIAWRATSRIRGELSWDWPPSNPCPGYGHYPVPSFLPGRQITKAHYKPPAGLREHRANPQHGQNCPAAGEFPRNTGNTRAPIISAILPESHWAFPRCLLHTLHSAQLTMSVCWVMFPRHLLNTNIFVLTRNCVYRTFYRIQRYNLSMYHMCRCFFASV